MDLIQTNNNKVENFYTDGELNKYFCDNSKKYQDTDVFLRLVMFDQLRQKFGFEIFGNMMIEARSAPKASLPTTDAERYDYIVLTASKVTGCNLIPSFDRWKFPFSEDARNTVNGNTQYKQIGDFTNMVGGNSFNMN